MNADDLLRELQTLSGLYDSVEKQLEHEHERLQAGDFLRRQELARGSELLGRLTSADKRLARLALERQAHGTGFPAGTGQGVDGLAVALADRARSLLRLVERNERLLLGARHAALNALGEIRCGARYLQSARGQQENQPRFIDAHQ
jgi:hypothetical protein